MSISLICTVYNEGPAVRKLLDSIVAQTIFLDEVVICDGGSSDDTVAQIEAYADKLPLRVIIEPGANISEGRNVAIAAAKGSHSCSGGCWSALGADLVGGNHPALAA